MVPITVMMVFLDTFGTKVFKNGLLVYGFPLLVCAGVCWCMLVCAGVCWCTLVGAGKVEEVEEVEDISGEFIYSITIFLIFLNFGFLGRFIMNFEQMIS